MREIQLTQNQVALVDDDMYEELNQFKWFANKMGNTFYAKRMSPTINGKRHVIHMHHEILGKPPKGLMTDHRDGEGLNNQRKNLRHVTRRQNGQNRKHQKTSSQYPGVNWIKRDKKWMAKIIIDGKTKYLAQLTDERKAFEAYRQAVNAIGEEVLEDFRYA